MAGAETRRTKTRKRAHPWRRLLFLSGALATLVASLVLSAPAAFTAGTPTGQEQIIRPVQVPVGVLVGNEAWIPPVDSNANPIDGVAADGDTITGTGYDNTGATVFGMVCDGNPPTAVGWSVAADCDSLTATAGIVIGTGAGQPAGEVQLNNNPVTDPVGVFRGIGPNDQFNCLAPADNPQGSTVNVPNLAAGATPASIDRTVPSWGSTMPLAPGIGGGTAACTVRIGYSSVNLDTTSDKFFPLALPQDASTVPPPVRTSTTVPNPNLPMTAPSGPPPTPPATPAVTAPGRSSPTTSKELPPTPTATTVTAHPVSPTTSTAAAHPSGSGATVPRTPGTGFTTAGGAGGVGGARSAGSGSGGASTESASSPTTVQLAAASTPAGTTNSQAYWYLLAGAAVCAIGVWAAELRDVGGGRGGSVSRGAGRGTER